MIKSTVILSAVVAITAGVWLGWRVWQPVSTRLDIAGIYLTQPKAVAEFTLTDDTGTPLTPAQLVGHWNFMYFGYTYCPDACPLAMGVLKQVALRLAEQGMGDPVQYWLVSVDPRRDTPERLAEYVRYFDPDFRGATGSPAELDKLAKPLGVYYSVPDAPDDAEGYFVDHSSAVVLINPAAELQALFTPPLDSGRIAADFAAVRKRYEAAQ